MLINRRYYNEVRKKRKKRAESKFRQARGQTILEYFTLIGIIAFVFLTMSAYVNRGIQGMIRLVADQVGVQNEADQVGNIAQGTSFLIAQNSRTRTRKGKDTVSRIGVFNYLFDDVTDTDTRALTNLGFTERR